MSKFEKAVDSLKSMEFNEVAMNWDCKRGRIKQYFTEEVIRRSLSELIQSTKGDWRFIEANGYEVVVSHILDSSTPALTYPQQLQQQEVPSSQKRMRSKGTGKKRNLEECAGNNLALVVHDADEMNHDVNTPMDMA